MYLRSSRTRVDCLRRVPAVQHERYFNVQCFIKQKKLQEQRTLVLDDMIQPYQVSDSCCFPLCDPEQNPQKWWRNEAAAQSTETDGQPLLSDFLRDSHTAYSLASSSSAGSRVLACRCRLSTASNQSRVSCDASDGHTYTATLQNAISSTKLGRRWAAVDDSSLRFRLEQ